VDYEVKDSGKRQEFTTGMVRDTQDGKPRIDLLSPFALMRIGVHMMKGSIKYDERNWEKGQPFSRAIASVARHLFKWIAGSRSEDHLSAIVFGCQAIMHYEEMIKRGLLPAELDDMPDYKAKEQG